MASEGTLIALVPPPLGVTPDLLYHEPQAKALALNITCIIIVTIFVWMRVYTKVFALKTFGWDDALLLFSWASTLTWFSICLKASQLGFGRHLWDIPITKLLPLAKWTWNVGNLYLVPILSAKVSIFLTYMRIFARRKSMLYLCWFGIFACTVFYVITIFRTIFACWPLEKNYDPFIAGHCLPASNLGYISGGFNAVSDMYITILPLPYVWSLQMPLKGKLRVASVFALGVFCVTVSWARFAETFLHFNTKDPFYDEWYILVWVVLELTVGLIAASCLVLPAFFKQVAKPAYTSLTSRFTTTRSSNTAGSSSFGSKYDANKATNQRSYNAYDSRRDLNESFTSSQNDEKHHNVPPTPPKAMAIVQTRTFGFERDSRDMV